MVNGPTTTDSPPAAAAPAEQRTRWWFVHLSIVASFLLFFVFVALLYWNWLRIDEPSAMIHIPRGTEQRAGLIIQVESYNLDQPLQLELTEENNYGGRIYVTPGIYTIKVVRDGNIEHEFSERTLLQFSELTLRLEHGAELQEQQ